MKGRYALFVGDDFYPSGGWDDYIGVFPTIDAAKSGASPDTLELGWAQVVDLNGPVVVARYDNVEDLGNEKEWR